MPRKFIQSLTSPGDAVLDPMVGSGTALLEAFLLGRYGIGVDIDPLALMITKAKIAPLDASLVSELGKRIVIRAKHAVEEKWDELDRELGGRWDAKTQEFINYWFAQETQIELLALTKEIERRSDDRIKAFFELAFSSIIITKSGGVSLAFGLAHTRPHKAKVVIGQTGQTIIGRDLVRNASRRTKLLTKRLRSPIVEFEKRIEQNMKGLCEAKAGKVTPLIICGNAQELPLDDNCVDLIVTSPPYASNAIDYMRAHKFSLAWFGFPIADLGQKREEYIGGESITDFVFDRLPDRTAQVVANIRKLDQKKARVLHRYYSEMARALREMFRVLKPGRAALVVVGSSVMRGKETETQICLAEIGQTIGFQVAKIGVRNLDRDRRMMPAGRTLDLDSQIQQRMHQEYVIGFYKSLV